MKGRTMGKEPKKTELLFWVRDIIIAVAIALILSLFVKPTVVKGDSMNPNFEEGDYLIATKIFSVNSLKKSDVVTFRNSDGRTFIKRVIGLPGDRVVVKDNKVYINGEEDDQSYTREGITDGNEDVTVPENTVFCMGDNRTDSCDSRDIGCITLKQLRWKVQARVYPFKKISADFQVYK